MSRLRLPIFTGLVLLGLVVASLAWVSRWRPLHSEPGPTPDLRIEGWRALEGVVHVHTRASDGGGTVHDVVRAARTSGLDFVVLTDHNVLDDREMAGDYGGVLVLGGVECTVPQGHVIFFDLPPAPLVGVEERGPELLAALQPVRTPVIAHPTNRVRPWRGEWISGAGIELISADSQWRGRSALELGAAILALPFVRSWAFASLVRPPTEALKIWQELPRPVAIIGSVNAHSLLELPGGREWRFPRYEDLFALIQTRAYLPEETPDDPSSRLLALRQALEAGRVDVTLPAFGRPPTVRFVVEDAGPVGEREVVGGIVVRSPERELHASVPHSGVPIRFTLWRNGERYGQVESPGIPRFDLSDPPAGAWRVQVEQVRPSRFGARYLPWVYTNEIHVVEADSGSLSVE